MARPRNSAETVTLTLSTTPQVKRYLEVFVADGTYGKNAAEAAERLIAEKIRELREGEEAISAALKRAGTSEAAQGGRSSSE